MDSDARLPGYTSGSLTTLTCVYRNSACHGHIIGSDNNIAVRQA
uniref:Uncharacterized protein n=1 Tax=Anguilla anguilla TaxID=7936 RepID=A0A0E9P6V3_ANGAN